MSAPDTANSAAEEGVPSTDFEPVNIDLKIFDAEWQRGLCAYVRIAAITVRDSKVELKARFRDNPDIITNVGEALVRESTRLKALADLVDAALARIILVGEEIEDEEGDLGMGARSTTGPEGR